VGSIPGWLGEVDQAVLRFILDDQRRSGVTGDLAELGVYLGKSAVLLGDHLQPSETFTVVDLFDGTAGDASNEAENATFYTDLTETAFRANYQRFHDRLPVIVRGPSTAIRDRARAGAHRLVHVDASHLYDHVRADVDTARLLLRPDGVVVFDDYRSPHTPGTAAAVWEAVGRTGLVPLLVSPVKLYGMWGDPAGWQQRLRQWLPTSGLEHEEQVIAGHPVLRVWARARPPSTATRVVNAVTPPAVRRLAGMASRRLAAVRAEIAARRA
jgi:hypothetical protein